MRSISFPWNTEKRLGKDSIRTEKKRPCFPYFKDKFIPDKLDVITIGFFPRWGNGTMSKSF